MNKTAGLGNFTDLTDTSATGNVSENIGSIYNTTQANNAAMSNDRQTYAIVKNVPGRKAYTGRCHFDDNCYGDYERDVFGSNNPIAPEKIASHEPTAVKKDKNQGTSGEPV